MKKSRISERVIQRFAILVTASVVASLDAGAQAAPALSRAVPAAPQWPAKTYTALVASESVDRVAVVELGPQGARVVRQHDVGVMLADPDGPHGVAVEPGGGYYYVTTAHGTPYGVLWKFDSRTNAYVDQVMLGNFPATAQVTPDGRRVVVVNFNLHGDMVASDVSVVRTDTLQEIARITTCAMPHGSRVNRAGTRHYSVCMMDEQLVEIDLDGLQVARHFLLTKGMEQGMSGAPPIRGAADAAHTGHEMGGHGLAQPAAGSTQCSPTWAQPSPDDRTVWVACNGTSDLVEIDVASWTLRRRLPAGNGVYNLAVTRDGTKLVASNKRGQSVSVIDTKTGATLVTLPTQRRVVHGVAITDDDRYAFVTVEGVGSEPGTVEIIDLLALRTMARVDVGQQAGGIDVLPPR
ncbi:MAG: YncE family protein [Gemmatimonas sp.]|jgi:DNA-binding beta-propeller fold protein YncE|uniref:YncE family protein n=1 Tax=Gemmatimonas sp. TaxID=1962908 RepID=UPI00391FC830